MDVSCGCFNGNVVDFDGLRLAWSQAAGYGVMDFRSQGGPVMPRLDYQCYSAEDMAGEWPAGAPDDPLIILLVHDEIKGRIKVEHCSYLADRLEELETVLMKQDQTALVLATQQFARGLRYAASNKLDVVFT